jgi:YidC/Oxa1 family membrane protein insertase
MKSLGIDLSHSAVKEIQDSFVSGLPLLLLVFLVGLTSWYQQRQIMARTKGNSAVNPTQQAVMKVVPFIWPVILLNLPSALAVYGLVSNLYRIGQQYYITRTLYRTDPVPAVVDVPSVETKVKARPDGPVLPPKVKKQLGAQQAGSSGRNRGRPGGEGRPRPQPKAVAPKPKPKPAPKARPRPSHDPKQK